MLSVTVPLISIPAAEAAVFIIQNIIKKSQTPFDPFNIRTFERGKEKRFFFIFLKFKINFIIKFRRFIVDAKLVNKESK